MEDTAIGVLSSRLVAHDDQRLGGGHGHERLACPSLPARNETFAGEAKTDGAVLRIGAAQ